MYVITDNVKLAQGIDDSPIVIPNNGPLTALIAVLPLQVGRWVGTVYVHTHYAIISICVQAHMCTYTHVIHVNRVNHMNHVRTVHWLFMAVDRLRAGCAQGNQS